MMNQNLTAEIKQLVSSFYEMLNEPQSKDLSKLSEIINPSWISFSNEETSKGKLEFIDQLKLFGRMIPNLKWEVKDVLVAGNKFVVRSTASGTPVDNFMGVKTNGKSFKIMAIDIHKYENNQLVEVFHVEDWASAIRQVTNV